MNLRRANNTLMVRADRIGDVILSTPAFQAFKDFYPTARLTVLVQKPLLSILQGLPCIDHIMIYEPQGRHAGAAGAKLLVEELKEQKFDSSIVLQHQYRLAWALWKAGIPWRVGPLSKLSSYFFYNHGMRQKRSQSTKHEADYNLELLQALGIPALDSGRRYSTVTALSEEAKQWAEHWLASVGLGADQSFVVIHPGMGGSASNWPIESYFELVNRLLNDKVRVLVTGGPAESDLIAQFKQRCVPSEHIFFYLGSERLDQFAAILQRAAVVVAPSTGPLHLAVSLQRPVVSFYPSEPVVESSRRWGPYGVSPDRAIVFSPEKDCGGEDPMKSLSVGAAFEKVLDLLEQREAAGP